MGLNTMWRGAALLSVALSVALGWADPVTEKQETAFVARFDANGRRLSTSKIDLATADIVARLGEDKSGNLWAARWHYSGGPGHPGGPDNALLKLDEVGRITLVLQDEFQRATGFAFDAQGNLYVGTLDGTLMGPPEQLDVVRKYSPTGDLLARFLRRVGGSNGYVIAVTSDDRIFSIVNNTFSLTEFSAHGDIVNGRGSIDPAGRMGFGLTITPDESMLFTYEPTTDASEHTIVAYDLNLNVLYAFEPGFCVVSPRVVCDPVRQVTPYHGNPWIMGLATLANGNLLTIDFNGMAFELSPTTGDLIRSFPLHGIAGRTPGTHVTDIRDFLVRYNGEIAVAYNVLDHRRIPEK